MNSPNFEEALALRLVDTSVQTIIVLMAYNWQFCLQNARWGLERGLIQGFLGAANNVC